MASYTVGLDLGQAQDYSALVVVERVLVLPLGLSLAEYHRRGAAAITGAEVAEEFHVVAIKRWELGTGYPAVATDAAGVMRSEALRSDAFLVYDATGVGRAVGDLFWQEWQRDRFGIFPPIAVTITAEVKRDMADAVLVPLQQGRLKIGDSLALAPVLEKELTEFRRRFTAAGNLQFTAGRDDGHGDVATALMLAMLHHNTYRNPTLIESPVTDPATWRH